MTANTSATAGRAAVGDEELLARFPGVPIDYDNAFHYRGLLERRLLINRCVRCGHWIYPHRPLCPECWSTDVVPTEVSGKGSVYFFTVVHHGAPIPGVEFPFALVAVELAEQQALRYLGTLVDCPNVEVRCGMPVALTWVERGGTTMPAFRPVAAERR